MPELTQNKRNPLNQNKKKQKAYPNKKSRQCSRITGSENSLTGWSPLPSPAGGRDRFAKFSILQNNQIYEKTFKVP